MGRSLLTTVYVVRAISPPIPPLLPDLALSALSMHSYIKIRFSSGEIILRLPPANPLQAHRSVHHPSHVTSAMSTHPRLPPAMTTPLPRHVSQPLIDLTLTVHIITVIEVVFLVDKPTHTTVHVHIAHAAMPLNIRHQENLRAWINPSNNTPISHRIIYHHLLISASSPLVPRDRSLSLPIDISIHSLTPPLSPIQRYVSTNFTSSSTYKNGSHISCTPVMVANTLLVLWPRYTLPSPLA